MNAHRLVILSVLGLSFASMEAHAQTWPTKPLRAIVPFAAGTVTDIMPRLVFEQIATQLGQTVIVENCPGAGGTTAANLVAKADPDGYTLLINSSAHTIAPALYPSSSYHPAQDFAAVISLGIVPSVLVVSPVKGFKSIADFVAAATARPGAEHSARQVWAPRPISAPCDYRRASACTPYTCHSRADRKSSAR